MTDALRRQLQESLGAAYTLERELRGGGMSRVFVAEETRFRRRVVIKVLAPELAEGLSAERFEREIGLAAALQEPHIVAVIAAGDVAGLPWYSMPYVEGESLRARIERGPMPVATALAVLRDIAKALAYAHARGVVHRDIKPENVLLSSGTALVADFGIAMALVASRTGMTGDPSERKLTERGMVLGTPAYMAPEQAAGDTVDARADLYAWGVVAYELLAGRHPFSTRTTAQQLIAAHIAEAPAPLPKVLPSALAALVLRCLAKDADGRPGSALAVLDALDALDERAASDPRTANVGRWRRRGTALAAASLVVIAVAVAAERYASRANGGRNAETGVSTVAVLPFVNVGRDARDEYLSDGMTDELARVLASLPGLRVAGRSSSYAFKGRNLLAGDVGRALHVAGLVQGTVQRAGDRLRVTAQLTSTANDSVMWSARYERAAGDIFAVQDEVTQSIVGALAPALRGARATGVATTAGRGTADRGTADTAAYDLYLRGQYLWRQRGTHNLITAADLFRRAIDRDQRFARGHSGLALTLAILPFFVSTNPDSLARLGLASAERAVALDSSLAEAHVARGRALHDLLRFPEARAEYARALVLDAHNASALQWLGEIDFNSGRRDAGIAAERRAQQLDPGSAVVSWALARQLMSIGRVPEGLVEARRGRDLDPSISRGHLAYGTALVLSGQLDSALAELDDVHRRWPEEPGVVAYLAYAYAAAARWSDVDRLRTEFAARRPDRVTHAERAAIALVEGDRDAAVSELERSVARHDLMTMTVLPACDPLWVPLRGDARFRALLARVGVAPCPESLAWPARARGAPR